MRRAGLSSKVKGDAARSEVARLQQLFNEVSAQNANAGDVADIDFGAYRNVIKTPGIVDSFESAYKSLSLPTFTADASEADAAFAELNATAESLAADSADRIAQLDAQIASMESNKLGPDTTVEDMYSQYPEVGEEIEQEIADMDWKKDT